MTKPNDAVVGRTKSSTREDIEAPILPYVVFGAPLIGEDEIAAVTSTMQSGWLGTGPRVTEFELAFSDYVHAPHAAALASCTAALHLSLLVAGVGPGDEVITSSLTFASTVNSIVHAGAEPVLVDADRITMNIDPAAIEAAITDKTKAIIAVHFAGRPCDMDRISEIANKRDIVVIEDAAHAIEAVYKGRHIGSISPFTCFSFYVTKNLTTVEGGMITSPREDLIDQVKQYSLHGLSADAWSRYKDGGFKHYEVNFPGFKYNMTDIQAAIGLSQLQKIEARLERRNEIWKIYDEAFSSLPCFLPAAEEPNTRHARHLYTLVVDPENALIDRDELINRLHRRGIGSGVHYRGVHLHKYYRERLKIAPDVLPNSTWISQGTLSLPLSAKLSDQDVERVVDAVVAGLS